MIFSRFWDRYNQSLPPRFWKVSSLPNLVEQAEKNFKARVRELTEYLVRDSIVSRRCISGLRETVLQFFQRYWSVVILLARRLEVQLCSFCACPELSELSTGWMTSDLRKPCPGYQRYPGFRSRSCRPQRGGEILVRKGGQ